jgi:hypothetical protein
MTIGWGRFLGGGDSPGNGEGAHYGEHAGCHVARLIYKQSLVD